MSLNSDVERLLVASTAAVLGEALQREVEALIDSNDARSLRELEPELRQIVGCFLPKRKKQLTAVLDGKLKGGDVQPTVSSRDGAPPVWNLRDLRDDCSDRLQELSSYHIFQWTTHYRKDVGDIFEAALDASTTPDLASEVQRMLLAEFQRHSEEIFSKGYVYTISTQDDNDAVAKSLSGLQKFLAIPVELYSKEAYSVTTAAGARALRGVCSAMLAGILLGYGSAEFGDRAGWRLLPQYPRSWANFLAFIRGAEAKALQDKIDDGEFRRGLAYNVAPVLSAIDRFMENANGPAFCLPRLGQFTWELRKVEISLSFPRTVEQKRYLEIQIFLDAGFVRKTTLEEAVSRGIGLIVASLRPDIRQWAQANDILRTTLVEPAQDAGALGQTMRAALDVLRFELNKQLGIGSKNEPITTNLALGFPLQNPEIGRYFHVYRPSVRHMVKTFENETGVRLWCSVRRSGKTTACLDLGAFGGNTVLINQTMDYTGPRLLPGADARADPALFQRSIFYQQVTAAIASGRHIDDNFFMSVVQRCATDPRSREAGRFVFVLDEYESLFDHLGALAANDLLARYRFVQPLLNQMVAFSRDNLLVFIGQRPDSHYIIMDQNQLSPYVRQDSFPLFQNDRSGATSEFDELLRKVLTERVTFDAGFSDAVYEETSGHPFLTVNVLVDFFQWMIDERRRFEDLDLDGGDFLRFARERLSSDALRRSTHFEFFGVYITKMLGGQVRQQQPWLYAVFTLLKQIGIHHPNHSCTEAEFAIHAKDILQEFQWDAEYLLQTATLSNFLSRRNGRVRPAIPVLARLAAVHSPRLV